MQAFTFYLPEGNKKSVILDPNEPLLKEFEKVFPSPLISHFFSPSPLLGSSHSIRPFSHFFYSHCLFA